MDEKLHSLFSELETFGAKNDARTTRREDKLLNLERPAAEFIFFMIRAMRLKRVLEMGTSNGYSALWLAYAVEPIGGSVTTVERSEHKAEMARANFSRSDLSHLIHPYTMHASTFLKEEAPASYDLLFLDAERTEYPALWSEFQRVVSPGGLMIADNALSHPSEMAPFLELVKSSPGYSNYTVPVGKGELMILKPGP